MTSTIDHHRTDPERERVIGFVRKRNDLSPAEVAAFFVPQHLDAIIGHLEATLRDLEIQFVAQEARLAQMRSDCYRAGLRGDLVEVQVNDFDPEMREKLPPAVALDAFTAREMRWKVRTQRFQGLVQDGLADARRAQMKVAKEDLLAAIARHKAELEAEDDAVSDLDVELYQAAERFREAT